MKYILNISIYLSLHAMISMWSVFYTYTPRGVPTKVQFTLSKPEPEPEEEEQGAATEAKEPTK